MFGNELVDLALRNIQFRDIGQHAGLHCHSGFLFVVPDGSLGETQKMRAAFQFSQQERSTSTLSASPAPNTFPMQESAVEATIQAGRQKIDVGFARGRAVVNG